ncbi:hypothetical protein HELRODRAFT_173020 [Helobdella robusta]|uniref:Uncharacterized protein n=1 Tax=Helobdella robusta TaxID=6412 RepID=T1F699_HELRO|nr:hypothetical protein HELRODRAFT_173020 [Helobdella robusta]ESO03976.1 hypothetical protein HELRODRAFT_173020 [Helobdella robusta]
MCVDKSEASMNFEALSALMECCQKKVSLRLKSCVPFETLNCWRKSALDQPLAEDTDRSKFFNTSTNLKLYFAKMNCAMCVFLLSCIQTMNCNFFEVENVSIFQPETDRLQKIYFGYSMSVQPFTSFGNR